MSADSVEYQSLKKGTILRSTKYKNCDDIYENSVNKGFEFTHHDINIKKNLESYKRKIKRMDDIRGSENICFLYHHRINGKTDIKKLVKKAYKFRSFYEKNEKKCYIAIFHQTIIQKDRKRFVELKVLGNRIFFFNFFTYNLWAGDNPDYLWAKVDDDLIQEMIKNIKTLTKYSNKNSSIAT